MCKPPNPPNHPSKTPFCRRVNVSKAGGGGHTEESFFDRFCRETSGCLAGPTIPRTEEEPKTGPADDWGRCGPQPLKWIVPRLWQTDRYTPPMLGGCYNF